MCIIFPKAGFSNWGPRTSWRPPECSLKIQQKFQNSTKYYYSLISRYNFSYSLKMYSKNKKTRRPILERGPLQKVDHSFGSFV